MNPYICVTYAQDDRRESDLFCRGLTRYGFRYSCINELSDPDRRGDILEQAVLLIALTSEAAVRAETVAADIRHALEQGMQVLCVSLEGNELDHRYCTGMEGGAALIPSPSEDTPDRHALALFVHRLYVRHLARLGGCFVEARCDDNVYGQLIKCAYYAHRGDGDACFELGRAYELGLGVPALEKEAAIWLKRAAGQDVCDALVRMGLLKLAGKGTERDPEGAFRLFTRAAELGDIRGMYRQGLCYLEGRGVMKDPIYAIECLQKTACMQYAPAMYRLAILHRDGIGTPRDIHTALKYLYAVCRQGYSEGEEERIPLPISVYGERRASYTCVTMRQMRHTRLHALVKTTERRHRSKASVDKIFGRNMVSKRDLPEDRWEVSLTELYTAESPKTASAVKGQPPQNAIYEADWTASDAAMAAYEMGCLLAAGSPEDGLYSSPTRALVWYRYAARLGHTEALYALGDAYRRGFGTPADTARAVELFRMAAEGGSERGQFAYAVCCERGIGVAVDRREAFRYYEQAAEGGFAPAQNNLGGCYEYGIGVPRNMVAAVEWYAAAANAGQPDGQCRLGVCYELGRGVSVDMDKAIRLYELAVEQGHPYAMYRRALCYDRDTDPDTGGDADGTLLMTESVTATDYEAIPDEDAYDRREPPLSPGMAVGRSPTDHTRAVSLYRQASEMGIPEAAYALYLCHRLERGISRDEREEILCLRRAAEGGCLQAAYELGLCYMEGMGLPKDQMAAVTLFRHAVDLWRACAGDTRLMAYLPERDSLPPDAFSPRQAAGGALYMLGYCALYGLGEVRDNREADLNAVPSKDRVAKAVPFFREAAAIDHVGALVMLGDLYAYRLLASDTASPEDEALRYYLDAERAETVLTGMGDYTRGMALRDRTDNAIDALMSLAERALDVANDESDPGSSEMARVNAWRSYSDCAARGSTDALVSMARCLYYGHGTPRNLTAALRLLRRAETMDGGRVAAALWLGDALRGQWDGGEASPAEADSAYVRGLESSCLESECGPYTLGLRRMDRRRTDNRTRAELLYRLATLRAMYFSNAINRRECFAYLAEAILMGHATARDDLARIFEYESKHPKTIVRKANRDNHRNIRFGRKARVRRRMRENDGMLNRNSRALRVHQEWLSDYYTALWLEPDPFTFTMHATAIESDLPDYVVAPVTDTLRANALQYLGECFFEGYGLNADAAAAVACYRAVLDYAPKGPNPPPSVVDATYSLGWCLLYGVGTAPNCQEAMRLLNTASKSHAGACYTLGLCHEEGRGVVAADDREAVKFYRKAQRLGHPKAAAKVAMLEKRLRAGGNVS